MKKFLIMALLAAPLFANAFNLDAQQGKVFRNHRRGGECCERERSHHHRRDRRSEQFGYFFTTSTQTVAGLPTPGSIAFTESGEHSRRVELDAAGNVVLERPGTYEVTFSVLAASGSPILNPGFRIDLVVVDDMLVSHNIYAVTTTLIGGELFGHAIITTENRNAVLRLENVGADPITLLNNIGNAALGAPHNISASITVEEITRRERRSD